MDNGWIKLHRKMFENRLWFMEKFTKAQAWIDLFANANHKEGSIMIRGNLVVIKRGQLGWSEVTMAKRWRWSRNKVRRFLNELEMEQQIEQQKDRFITTIITVLNYDVYQQTEQQKDSRRNINKNDKNEKNNKKEEREGESRFAPPSLEEVSSYCLERKNGINAQSFIDFYTSKGWLIGKNKMKDWKAAIRTWENRNKPAGNQKLKSKYEGI